MIALGIGFGLLGAFGVARAMQSLLYGVTVIDLLTFVAVPTLLAVVALFACLTRPAARQKVACLLHLTVPSPLNSSTVATAFVLAVADTCCRPDCARTPQRRLAAG
ncbi:MAG: hypothetical protein U0X75_28525 [Acidobacteriota bacterium]